MSRSSLFSDVTNDALTWTRTEAGQSAHAETLRGRGRLPFHPNRFSMMLVPFIHRPRETSVTAIAVWVTTVSPHRRKVDWPAARLASRSSSMTLTAPAVLSITPSARNAVSSRLTTSRTVPTASAKR